MLAIARTLARVRASPFVRASSTLRGDQEHLHDILDQAESARGMSVVPLPHLPCLTPTARDEQSPSWQAARVRRKFAPGLVRPPCLLRAHL